MKRLQSNKKNVLLENHNKENIAVGKKLAKSSLFGFCSEAYTCKRSCRDKKVVKLVTRDGKIICPYTLDFKDIIYIEQLQLLPDTNV